MQKLLVAVTVCCSAVAMSVIATATPGKAVADSDAAALRGGVCPGIATQRCQAGACVGNIGTQVGADPGKVGATPAQCLSGNAACGSIYGSEGCTT